MIFFRKSSIAFFYYIYRYDFVSDWILLKIFFSNFNIVFLNVSKGESFWRAWIESIEIPFHNQTLTAKIISHLLG